MHPDDEVTLTGIQKVIVSNKPVTSDGLYMAEILLLWGQGYSSFGTTPDEALYLAFRMAKFYEDRDEQAEGQEEAT